MPHARLWGEADSQYALDTAELAASAFQRDAKVGLLAELRLREKTTGTTWGARQDLRIRYIEPTDESTPARLTSLEEHRDLWVLLRRKRAAVGAYSADMAGIGRSQRL